MDKILQPDEPEVTSELHMKGIPAFKFERALTTAIAAMAQNGEPSSATLEDILTLRDIRDELRNGIVDSISREPHPAGREYVPSKLATAIYSREDFETAVEAVNRVSAKTGVPPVDVVRFVAEDFGRKIAAAGFDPVDVREKLNAAVERGDTDAARRLMARVSKAIRERKTEVDA